MVCLLLGGPGPAISQGPLPVPTAGKWRRHVVEIVDTSPAGNPFEVILNATFTNATTGTSHTLPGYYAGGDSWRIGFMPDELGLWSWMTSSPDPDLNGRSGTLHCVPSGLPGLLRADPDHARKWKLSDGEHVVPIALRMEFFIEPAPLADFEDAADFLREEVDGHLFETRLTDEHGWYGGRTDWIFQGPWTNHAFDLANFDRMESRMEALAARGLGAHVMFYSDDQGAPGWNGQSPTEALVIRYVVARLCGYPIVWFGLGIDVQEYRSQADVDWFGLQVRSLDPYGHPVSSRHGGGSGGMIMSGQTFDSDGLRTADTPAMIQAWVDATVPVSFDDAWGENRGSHPAKDHTAADIRRAFWKCLLAGGTGGLVRGGGDGLPGDGFFSILNVEADLESEQWLRLLNPFVRDRLGPFFPTMVPEPSLAAGGAYCISDPTRERLLYYVTGTQDRYDPGSGGPFTARLSGLVGAWQAAWFDPRTGLETPAGAFAGGADVVVMPPTNEDWALLMEAPATPAPSGNPAATGAVFLENVPNPFRKTTRIRYALPAGSVEGTPMRLAIYDVRGRLVRVLLEGRSRAGFVEWGGTDDRGETVGPGTYFGRLEAGPEVHTRKMLRVR